MAWGGLTDAYKNIVFLGESGCGKSELALNLALELCGEGSQVHLWDMDQTKPLFRARDMERQLADCGVTVHYDVQLADTPTVSGGIIPLLLDPESRVILDVGGGDAGARLIGGFSHLLRCEDVIVFYVINPYCAWSGNLAAIDETLSAILNSARIQQVHFLANPNLGDATTAADFTEGLEKVMNMLPSYAPLDAAAISHWLAGLAVPLPTIPVRPQLRYPWQNDEFYNFAKER